MLRWVLVLLLLATAARAETPRVMTDILPVQSLVDRVMVGVGTADVLLPPGASPHDFALRPSDAARLAQAQLVIWVGPGLTPWLKDPLDALSGQVPRLTLLDAPGWDRLPLRTDPAFATEETPPAPEAMGLSDPHAWLDPVVASAWLVAISNALGEVDPENAALYAQNAATAQAELLVLEDSVNGTLAPVHGRGYLVPHDAYQYFGNRFDMPAIGAITLSDAAAPGPARIAALKDMVAAGKVACILTDPETSARWSDVLREDTTAKTAAVDPLGGSFPPGPDLYPRLIGQIASALAACLS